MRRFNRFYTKQIGVLEEGLLQSPYSLTEVRVLYELARVKAPTATDLGQELRIDLGYLSRILRGFEKQGLVRRRSSPADGRQSLLALTTKGRKTFEPLDGRSSEQVAAMLGRLAGSEQKRLIDAMRTVERVLDAPEERDRAYLLRPPRAGELGWVVHRHGVLYAREYGWDEKFEALVAGIVGKFGERHDPRRERCWIAERDGEIVGSVFLVKKSDTVAKLRLLYVEPDARGLGIGAALVGACVDFARAAGYRKLVLWTQSVLSAARRIYQKSGFRLVREEPHSSFGHDLVSEIWEREL